MAQFRLQYIAGAMLLPILCVGLLHAQSQCALTGTYNLGPGNDGNQATAGSGPFHLTATNNTFSYVDFVPFQSFTFSQITSLFATFTSNSGGSGGGTPRISVDLNVAGTPTGLLIYLGKSPNFTDSDTVLNTYSGVNLIGNNDAGRYDTSGFTGGSPATTYSSALALVGSLQVVDIAYITDTFGNFPSRDETFNGFGGNTSNVCQATPSDYLYTSWWFWYVV